MIHLKLLARAWHKFSKNVHCYFYCCYLLTSGVGLQMCHPYKFVSVKQGDANKGSQGTPRCPLENILDSNLDLARHVWITELYVPCKRTLSTFLVDFHAFFFWGILFPLLNSKRAGYTKYILGFTYLKKTHHNIAFLFLLLIQMLIKEIALGSYVTVLSIFRRICKH